MVSNSGEQCWTGSRTDCHIVETGNESYRLLQNSEVAKTRIKAKEQARKGDKTD